MWLHPEEENMQFFYIWLEKMKKGDERKKMEEMYQQRVNQMIKSAEGMRVSTAWRGGAQILKEEEDARLLNRCEAKRKEWVKRWQCDESVPNAEDKL